MKWCRLVPATGLLLRLRGCFDMELQITFLESCSQLQDELRFNFFSYCFHFVRFLQTIVGFGKSFDVLCAKDSLQVPHPTQPSSRLGAWFEL